MTAKTKPKPLFLGIDTGGTYTDAVLWWIGIGCSILAVLSWTSPSLTGIFRVRADELARDRAATAAEAQAQAASA